MNELYDPSNFFLDLKSRNHFVLIPRDRLKLINSLHIFYELKRIRIALFLSLHMD